MFNRNNNHNNGHEKAEETETARWQSATVLDERRETANQAPDAAPEPAAPEAASLAEALQRPVAPPMVTAPAPVVAPAAPTAPATPAAEVFVLVRRLPDGRIEVWECASEAEMENLIGEIISLGEDQMNISAYHGSKIEFEINLRPTVRILR